MKFTNIRVTVLIIVMALNFCACRKTPTAEPGLAPQLETSQTDALPGGENGDLTNQAAGRTASTTLAQTRATVVVQVHSASTNRKTFHVSLEGLVGDAAPKIAPGGGVNLQREIDAVDGKFPVSITVSRNGEAVAVLSQSIGTTSCSVIIFENKPNEFNAQWI